MEKSTFHNHRAYCVNENFYLLLKNHIITIFNEVVLPSFAQNGTKAVDFEALRGIFCTEFRGENSCVTFI